MNNIFIPEKIRVGYQNRKDTYTGKLSYVIYFKKNKLHKEKSWESWRDKSIEYNDFQNEPLEGFVLNKKVGDYHSDWNHRHAYCRVYDPRGFEFEISIENLLYILQNTNSIKGKGLEGSFVYGWNSKDLILIPTESPDYQELTNYSSLINNPEKIKTKDLILGATYLTNQNESWIYLGKFDYENKDKRFYFHNGKSFEKIKDIKKIIKLENPEPVNNYAELMDRLEYKQYYSPIDYDRPEYILKDEFKNSYSHYDIYNKCYKYDYDYAKVNGEFVKVVLNYKNPFYNKTTYHFYRADSVKEINNTSYYRPTLDYPESGIIQELGEYSSEKEALAAVNLYYKVYYYLKNGKRYNEELSSRWS